MVAIDSTSYPCLAVIEHYGTDPETTYRLGQEFLAFVKDNGPYPNVDIDPAAYARLRSNYSRAAVEFGWWPSGGKSLAAQQPSPEGDYI